MEKNVKKKFNFGKIDYYGNGRKANAVEIEVEIRTQGGEPTFTVDPKTREKTPTGKTTPIYNEFTIHGDIWNGRHPDILTGGQCLDTIAKTAVGNNSTFKKLYDYWKRYHLNGMHAGTPEQEKAVKEWEASGNSYDYTKACDYLKKIGLYEVNFYGKTIGEEYNGQPYKYGHGWVVEDLPQEVIDDITSMCQA